MALTGNKKMQHNDYFWLVSNISQILVRVSIDGNFQAKITQLKRKFGGYICITDLEGEVFLHLQFGECEQVDAELHRISSLEEARRLAGHPDDFLASQSSRPHHGMDGGAVKGNSLIVAFSGCSREIDEILALKVSGGLSDEAESVRELIMSCNSLV